MKLPKIEFENLKKEFGYVGRGIMPTFKRRWSGKLWYLSWRHYSIVLDFRENVLKDLFGERGWRKFSMYFRSWLNRN